MQYTRLLSPTEYVALLVQTIGALEGHVPNVYNAGDPLATIGYGYTFNRNDNVAIWTQAGISLTPAEWSALQAIDAASAGNKTALSFSTWTRRITHTEAKSLLEYSYQRYEGPANNLNMPLSPERVAFVSLTYNRGVGGASGMTAFATALQQSNRADAWYEIRYNALGNIDNREGKAKRRFIESQLFGLYDHAGVASDVEARQTYSMLTRNRAAILAHEALYGQPPDGSQATRNMIAVANNDRYLIAAFGATMDLYDALTPARNTLVTWLNTQLAGGAHTLLEGGWNPAAIAYNDPTNPLLTIDLSSLDGKGIGMDRNLIVGGDPTADYIIAGAGRDFVFSQEGDDFIEAGTGEDTVYAGGGNDEVYGGSENDWIAGGRGTDILYGEEGDDFLAGAAGSWKVGDHAAPDNDMLVGGTGTDTYFFCCTFGHDTVIDADGLGRILIEGAELKGGVAVPGVPNLYKDAADYSWYYLVGSTLFVGREGIEGTVEIRNWSAGRNLGITLGSAAAPSARPTTSSPLVLDLNGDGVQTLGTSAGVFFDHDGDGFAELTGWVAPTDALLVRDLNGDGAITSGRELFGSGTLLPGGTLAANGFEALRSLDDNGDGVLDAYDQAFSSLKIWTDSNSNGLAEVGELTQAPVWVQGLGAVNFDGFPVASVNTTFGSSSNVDANGNEHRQIGNYESAEGQSREIVDVWFRTETGSVRTEAGDVAPEIAAMPDIEGRGVVSSLHVAMSGDSVLRQLVEQFQTVTDPTAQRNLMRSILWRWTGADAHAPDSRGPALHDARWLYMLEAFRGQGFIQGSGPTAGATNPGPMAAAEIVSASRQVADYLYYRLMSTTHLEHVFSQIGAGWQPGSRTFGVSLSRATEELVAAATLDRAAGMILVGQFVEALAGAQLLTPSAVLQLEQGLAPIGPDAVALVSSPVISLVAELPIEVARAGADSLVGTSGTDTLYGGAGNDSISGLAENDELIGGFGSDTLRGGAGNDTMSGNDGSDVYLFNPGDGHDVIYNSDGDVIGTFADEIRLGWTASQVIPRRIGNDLILSMSGGSESLRVVDYFDSNGASIHASQLVFSDGAVWTAASLTSRVLVPSNGNDLLTGASPGEALSGGEGNDTIYGNGGNDNLTGGLGDDSLNGGAGSDSLDGGAGHDRLDGGAGTNNYYFGRGDGQDTISAHWENAAERTGTLWLKAGVLPSDVVSTRSTNDLVLRIVGTADTITVEGFFTPEVWVNSPNPVSRIAFNNGTNWTRATIDPPFVPTVSISTDGQGIDTVTTDGSFQLQPTQENITNTGIRNTSLVGNANNNLFVGNAGNNVFNAPGLFQFDLNRHLATLGNSAGWLYRNGVDTMIGGAGDDIYFVGVPQEGNPREAQPDDDLVVESVNQGTDTIISFAYSTELEDNVENLFGMSIDQWSRYEGSTLVWTPIPHGYVGNALSNLVDASRAAGTINIDGREGADTLIGSGYATNTFSVDNAGDVVIIAGGGFAHQQTVASTVSYTLGSGIGNLRLSTSQENPAVLVGTGNSQDNVLTAANLYFSVAVSNSPPQFSAVGDTLIGLAGDDRYIVDVGDFVVEQAGGGNDTVVVTGGTVYDIASYANVENLEAAFSGTLIGDAAANVIKGGLYSNIVFAGAGNDTVVDTNVLIAPDYRGGEWQSSDSDELHGGEGDDQITVTLGHDHIFGDEGNDQIVFRQAHPPRDMLGQFQYGLIPSGTVNLSRGDGHDVVDFQNVPDGYRSMNVRFTGGIDVTDIHVLRDGTDLLLGIDNDGGTVTVRNAFSADWAVTTPLIRVGLAFEGFSYVDVNGNSALSNFIETKLANGVENLPTDEHDVLVGTHGGDTIVALEGNDSLFGGEGNDTLDGSGGADQIWGGTGDDVIYGGLSLGQGHYIRDFLDGGIGNDTLVGGDSYDQIIGGEGDDVLSGGTSATWEADQLHGGLGNDTYLIARDAGYVDVFDRGGNDVIIFGEGVAPSDILVLGGRYRPHIRLETRDGSLTVTIEYGFAEGTNTYAGDDPANYHVEAVRFADGTVWTVAQLQQMAIRVEGTGVGELLQGSNYQEILLGYEGDDSLEAYGGNDTLDGGLGADTLRGGDGDDLYIVDSTSDSVFELFGEGTDTLHSTVTRTLGSNVENLVLVGTGNINGVGNSLANLLVGNAFANTLNGGSGADTLQGGAGNDIYVVDNLSDVVIEVSGEGVDLVQSGVNYSLTDTVENLTLTGTSNLTGTGNALNNVITGNSGANTLTGGAGADTLNGGLGTDSLSGGTGNDTYVVDVTADLVTEGANEGVDLVQSTANYILSANVENLTLTSTGATSGTGNTLDNVLTGNGGNNTLTGHEGNDTLDGGSGSDSLLGGLGNDTYVVNVTTDVITENANQGIDTVLASLTWTLNTTQLANVENVTLGGTSAFTATGNGQANLLIGNGANNRLTGLGGNDTLDGGLGNDTLVGGLGDDTYLVNVSTDVVTELANEGTDTVQSSVTITSLSTNVENLTLIGTGITSGTGNALANVLTGNAQSNTLTGQGGTDTLDGGAGNDILDGGVGADTYLFGRGCGADTVRENDSTANVKDRIQLGAGIVQGDMRYSRVGNNLEALIFGTTDKVVVQDWYLGNQYHVEEFRFANGSILTDSQVQGLVGAMATFSAASATDTGGGRTAARGTPLLDHLSASALL